VKLWLTIASLALASTAWAHKPTITTFTYNKDVFPIFAAKCGSCHRTGGVAPMSLLTYKEAYPWGVSIKNEVLNLAMPPWFADERYGVFKHGAGLTAKEMDTIVDWCLGGSPEGDTAKGNSAADVGGWILGEPDVELRMPSAVVLDAETSEAIEEVTFETDLARIAYIGAVDFKPGAGNIVRSATVIVDGADTPLATWIPGQFPESLPDGSGHALPAGARIKLRLHYKKTWLDEGRAVEDRSVLALYLRDGAATPVETIEVTAGAAHIVDGDAELVALLARVDAAVENVVAELVRPDGSREGILRLYQPNPDWPRKYWLDKPVAIPTGSRVEVSVTSDEDTTPAVLLDFVTAVK
jgi:hypothetical protein